MHARKRLRLIIILAVVGVAGTGAWFISRSPDTSKLAAFKAELRARGEKLTMAELGYPRPAQSGLALDRLLAGINHLGPTKLEPWRFQLLESPSAGRALVAWRATMPPRGIAGTNQMNWAQLGVEFEDAAGALAEIRAALTNPPAHFFSDFADLFNGTRPPYVELRKAAQWLAGDTVVAMQLNQKARARADLVAIAQLALVHREDPTLVCQMIRTAIAGLGLAATWDAMQTDDWKEADLAAMQQGWETVDMLEALERALTGERTIGERGFEMARDRDPDFQWPFNPNSRQTLGERLQEAFVGPYWRMHIDSDELLMLQHYQISLEAIRRIRGATAWPEVQKELAKAKADFDRELNHPLKRYHYLLSAMVIPNTTRAATTVVRNEVQRRLTITALALERHRLLHGNYPADLKALIPEFLAAVPRDLMSTQPLCYRFDADGMFTLYSVGEDGRDDIGDPQPVAVTNRFDLWSGRDAVWPKAAD